MNQEQFYNVFSNLKDYYSDYNFNIRILNLSKDGVLILTSGYIKVPDSDTRIIQLDNVPSSGLLLLEIYYTPKNTTTSNVLSRKLLYLIKNPEISDNGILSNCEIVYYKKVPVLNIFNYLKNNNNKELRINALREMFPSVPTKQIKVLYKLNMTVLNKDGIELISKIIPSLNYQNKKFNQTELNGIYYVIFKDSVNIIQRLINVLSAYTLGN